MNAFQKAVEGAEDSQEFAVNDLKAIALSNKDIVIGIASSGRTLCIKRNHLCERNGCQDCLYYLKFKFSFGKTG